MRSIPILFKTEMIRAYMAGLKGQTRRGINRLKGFGPITEFGISDTRGYEFRFRDKARRWHDASIARVMECCPYGGAGDELWFKETWYQDNLDDPKDLENIYYRADGECCQQIPECQCADVGKPRWRPSIFMPRWASRFTVPVLKVRVERLQDISEADAEAEGVDFLRHVPDFDETLTARDLYQVIWEQINGEGSWDANPWVWVIEFERMKR